MIYVTSYFANVGGQKLWMYDYQDGNVLSAHFGDFLGALDIPASITSIQGVEWKDGSFYFSAVGGAAGNRIERVPLLGDHLATYSELLLSGQSTFQGIGFAGELGLITTESGATTETIYTFKNLAVPEPSARVLLSLAVLALLVVATRRPKSIGLASRGRIDAPRREPPEP